MVQTRVRIRFCKQGDLRLISHRDLLRALERLFSRAGITLRMSEGFHPKPKMSLPSALALGIAGLDEVLEMELAHDISSDDLLARLNAHAPPGMAFHSVEPLLPGAKKAQVKSCVYETAVPRDRLAALRVQIAALLAADSFPIERDGRQAAIDMRPLIEGLDLDDDVLRIKLRVVAEAGARPRDVLEAVGLGDMAPGSSSLTRTAVELAP